MIERNHAGIHECRHKGTEDAEPVHRKINNQPYHLLNMAIHLFFAALDNV